MYIITRLDTINSIFICLFVVSAMILAFLLVFYFINVMQDEFDETDKQISKKFMKVLGSVCAISFLIVSLVPTTKEYAAIKIVPTLLTQENCQKLKTINNGLLDYAKSWLDDMSSASKKTK